MKRATLIASRRLLAAAPDLQPGAVVYGEMPPTHEVKYAHKDHPAPKPNWPLLNRMERALLVCPVPVTFDEWINHETDLTYDEWQQAVQTEDYWTTREHEFVPPKVWHYDDVPCCVCGLQQDEEVHEEDE